MGCRRLEVTPIGPTVSVYAVTCCGVLLTHPELPVASLTYWKRADPRAKCERCRAFLASASGCSGSQHIQAGHVAESGARLVEFATPDETIAAVRTGEADAVLADSDYLRPIVDESGDELAVVGEPVPIGSASASASARAIPTFCRHSTRRSFR